MLNIYRVISLSLVMSLFFAAPLLFVHPVSLQVRNEQRLATKNNQAKKVKAAWKNRAHTTCISPTAALAKSLHRSENDGDELLYESEDRVATPAIFVQDQIEDWYDDDSVELDDGGVVSGVNVGNTASRSSLYY